MSEPCDLLQVETELDLIEGELAVELPAHMRAFARAHGENRPAPAAPTLLTLSATLQTARNAMMHDVLADRGLALLRLAVPLVIESDPRVARVRAEAPSWDGLQRLAAARDSVARAYYGTRAIELLHLLHGSAGTPVTDAAIGPDVDGWHVPESAIDQSGVDDAWQAVAARLGIRGSVRIDRAGARAGRVQPRAFVVEPKREVIIVVPPAIDTPAARFAVLHELGHAFVALAMSPGVPRSVDEAAAAYVARAMEPPSWLPPRWSSELAPVARVRRRAIAVALDAIERALPELPSPPPSSVPPWALWHDPGAQAAYVAAEDIVERVRAELGPNPPRGQVLRALVAERDRIDQRTQFPT